MRQRRFGNVATNSWAMSGGVGMRLRKITSVHFRSVLARSVITPALASWSLRSKLLARSFTVPSPYTMASVSVRGSAVERRAVRGATEGRGKGGERRGRGGEGGKWWKEGGKKRKRKTGQGARGGK